MTQLKGFFAMILALIGPAPADMPKDFQLKSGDTIVAIGDSITQQGGYLRDIDAVLTQLYPEMKLAKVVNKGIGGQKAEDLLARFEKDVVQLKPTYVTISIGINDVWHRVKNPHDPKVLAAYRENVAKMVDMAQAAGIKVILLTPTIIEEKADSEGNRRLVGYVDAIKQIAAEKKCQLVDLHDLFLKIVKMRPDDFPEKSLTTDGVHMNAAGNGLMAIGVLRALGVSDEKITTCEPFK
jgi:lysophospholipase L1-like esterase